MTDNLERFTFLISLSLFTVLFGLRVMPSWVPLFWAITIAVLFHPMQVWLEKRWADRPDLTALTTLLVCVVLVVAPGLLMFAAFLQQTLGMHGQIEAGINGFVVGPLNAMLFLALWPIFSREFNPQARAQSEATDATD